jgi:hypothetical protein
MNCIALIGSTGFFEVFRYCDISEQYAYWHFPVGTYHWSNSEQIYTLGNRTVFTVTGVHITRDPRMRDLVRTIERLP